MLDDVEEGFTLTVVKELSAGLLKRLSAKRVSYGPALWSLAARYTTSELGSTFIAREIPES